jgi:hypothetical protein
VKAARHWHLVQVGRRLPLGHMVHC